MPSQYLTAEDSATYGVSTCASTPQIVLASTLIDSYLRRPKGLVYIEDANGNPAMMSSAVPDMNFTLTAPISPGQNIAATLAPMLITPDFVGEVLVIDAGTSGLMEACQVISVSGNDGVIFSNVQFAHSSGATAQTGLTLLEERSLPNKRSVTMASELPLVNVLSLLGRYAYGRRSDQVGGLYQEMNLLASVQTFGGPPQWIIVDTHQLSLSQRTGQVWVPAGMLLAYYSDVRVRYIAGWTATGLPPAIKMAAASLVTALGQTSGTPPSIQNATAASSSMKRFTASVIDSDIQRMLDPFRANIIY